jgi:hypothetical protein
MKISPISEYMSLAAEHPIRVRLALNISAQISLMQPFPVHMSFQLVLRLPFMRDDHEGGDKDDWSYLVGSLNE